MTRIPDYKPDIKIVGLDLDGTTLNTKGEFSDLTKEVFQKAMKKGVHIVIATGRTLNSLPKEIYDIEGLEYAITSNGAKVFKLENHQLVYENSIEEEAVENLVEIFREHQLNVEGFADGRAYISQKEFDDIKEFRSKRDRKYVLKTRTPVEDIYSFLLEHKHHIENISINYPNDERKEEIEKVLKQVDGITVTSSFPLNNEIGGATTSKADGLNFLLAQLGLEFKNLMVVGDSPNDLAMIKEAEIGVAMGNAEESVKAQADYITLTNAEDGVARAIEKFVL